LANTGGLAGREESWWGQIWGRKNQAKGKGSCSFISWVEIDLFLCKYGLGWVGAG